MFTSLWSEFRYRLRALVRRDLVERELDDEVRFHLERHAEQLIRAGAPRDDAMRRARLAFGGVNRIKDDTRDARGTTFLEHVAHDLRYAIRGLRARPAFTAVVVATIGLGVGVNAAMFGVLDRLLLRAPAYTIDAPLVHRVYLSWMLHGRTSTERNIEYTTYADLRRWSTAFSATAAFAYQDIAVGSGEDIKDLVVATVSASYFDFFNARPVVGRFFAAQEDVAPDGTAVAVLTYDYWQTRYAGRTDVLGTMLKIGREAYRIIGVAPRQFVGVNDQRSPVAFIPITKFAFGVDPNYARTYGWSWLEMLARRRPGVSVEAAMADMTSAYRRSWNVLRETDTSLPNVSDARVQAIVSPVQLGRGPQSGPESKVAVWVSGVAFIVLLVACANVANLLLVRALRRRRELALRNALGASRARIVGQMLAETLVLAALGGVAGIMAAQWGGGTLRRAFLDASTPSDVFGDTRTLMFSGAITLATALVAGLLPALRANRQNLADSLKAGSRDGAYRRSRTRNALLVSQAALSVILLIGAGLFVRSLQQIRAVRLGYDVDPVVVLMARFRGPQPEGARLEALTGRLIAEAQSMPGVVNATPLVSIPFFGSESRTLSVPGVDSVRRLGRFTLQAASPEYFATVGTRILRGRGIEDTDRANAPRIAIVSEAMAKALWPARDAIGQCIRIGSDTVPCTTVVGVAENVRMASLTGAPEFHYYLPIAQHGASYIALSVRVSGHGAEYTESVRRQLQRVMPADSYLIARPMHDLTNPTMRPWEFGATMFVAFGVLALAVAAIGLYSVIAFGVTQRTHELGVRIALGAQIDDVLRLVVGEGVRLTLVGVVVGAAIALAAGRWTSPLLFHVSSKDPLVYALVMLTLIVVGVLASAIPATRAARVDPNVALRAE